jgi:FkbM family methyltransferase
MSEKPVPDCSRTEVIMSSRLREMVASRPGTRAAWRLMKSLPGQLAGLPPIDYSNVSGQTLRSCVGRPDPVIIEIGCNDGANTMWFLHLFENPTICCFEPDPRAIERCKEKVGARRNVTLFELAVSDREGFVDFHQCGGRRDNEWIVKAMPQGWDLSGSIKQPYRHLRVHPLVTFDQTIRVPTTEYSNQELYKGQQGLRAMVRYLGGFRLLHRYPGDALFSNYRLRIWTDRLIAAGSKASAAGTTSLLCPRSDRRSAKCTRGCCPRGPPCRQARPSLFARPST